MLDANQTNPIYDRRSLAQKVQEMVETLSEVSEEKRERMLATLEEHDPGMLGLVQDEIMRQKKGVPEDMEATVPIPERSFWGTLEKSLEEDGYQSSQELEEEIRGMSQFLLVKRQMEHLSKVVGKEIKTKTVTLKSSRVAIVCFTEVKKPLLMIHIRKDVFTNATCGGSSFWMNIRTDDPLAFHVRFERLCHNPKFIAAIRKTCGLT